jgi:DNA-binding transcriptional regulator YiaG
MKPFKLTHSPPNNMADSKSEENDARSRVTEDELYVICDNLYPVLFRFGILLGVDFVELEVIMNDSVGDPWSKCRRVIERWRNNTPSHLERIQLSEVLTKLKYTRYANMIHKNEHQTSSSANIPEHQENKDSDNTLTRDEIDLICQEISVNWEIFATYMNISQNDIAHLRMKPTTLYHKTYWCIHRMSMRAGIDRLTILSILRQMGKGRLARVISTSS